jgi:hypothetical protein
MQGMGVSTPRAAAVAEATAGLAGHMHIAKEGMFTSGMLSMIVADGWTLVVLRLIGSTVKTPGAIPNEHVRMAPLQT